MCSGRSDWALPQPGFPIRRSTDQSLVDSSPWLFAATHVLHRHLAPRHPPLALSSLGFLLALFLKIALLLDARAHSSVLKGQPAAPSQRNSDAAPPSSLPVVPYGVPKQA